MKPKLTTMIFVIAMALALPALAAHNMSVSYETSVKGNASFFGDLYLKAGDPEVLRLNITNQAGDNITTVNVTLQPGFNLTGLTPPANWSSSNTTNSSNWTTVVFENTTNESSISSGQNLTFDITIELENSTFPADGEHNIAIITGDDAGGLNSSTATVIVDNTQPSITSVTHDGNTTILVKDDVLHVNATGEANCTARFSVAGLYNATMPGDGNGNYTGSYTVSQGDDGAGMQVTVFLEDAAGNTNSSASADTTTFDTNSPFVNNITVDSQLFSQAYAGEFNRTENITIVISAGDSTTSIENITGLLFYPNSSNESVQPAEQSDGVWELNVTDTSQTGRYNISLTLEDSAGNSASYDAWFDVYEQAVFSGDATNSSAIKNVTMTFYRQGTSDAVHNTMSDEEGNFSLTVGSRQYDVGLSFVYPDNNETHEVLLKNYTAGALGQWPVQLFNVSVNTTEIGGANNSLTSLGLYANASANVKVTLNFSGSAFASGPGFVAAAVDAYSCSPSPDDNCTSGSMLDSNVSGSTIIVDAGLAAGSRTAFFAAEPPVLTAVMPGAVYEADVTASIYFYRPGTTHEVHSLVVNQTTVENATLYDREYDVRADVLYGIDGANHTVELYGARLPVNATPLKFDYLRYCSTPSCGPGKEDADGLHYPYYVKKVAYAGISVEPAAGLTFASASITINYSRAYNYMLENVSTTILEQDLYVYKCSKHDALACASGEWSVAGTCSTLACADRTVVIPVSSFSSYVLWGEDLTNSPPPGEPSGGGGGISSYCGDDICGFGESPESCPEDCGVNATCGNAVCDPGEDWENCPDDCAITGDLPFSARTTLADAMLYPGQEKGYTLWIVNSGPDMTAEIFAVGEAAKYITFEKDAVDIAAKSAAAIVVTASVPAAAYPGIYTGMIVVSSSGMIERLPVVMRVSREAAADIDLSVTPLSKKFRTGESALFSVTVYNLGLRTDTPVNLTYTVRNMTSEEARYSSTTSFILAGVKELELSVPLEKEVVPPDRYFIDVTAYYSGGRSVYTSAAFEVVDPFWTPKRTLLAAYWLILLGLSSSVYYAWSWYKREKRKRARYLTPSDVKKLPQQDDRSFWIGRIADMSAKAWLGAEDLLTHVIVAGSTGSGKSVSASVIVEEALLKKIPVAVFDPTAQWSGFVRPCKDENLLKYYSKFGMKRDEARPFRGLVFDVDSPDIKVNMRELAKPGEVTVFNLSKLKPGEYDQAVQHIVDTVFEEKLEESSELEMIVVFDEVHRLLEKYGGKGGYKALEKACREFRKWGIGLVLASQVSTDFKEAVQGNILTEVQLNTKSMEDIKRYGTKYGEEFAQRITRQAVGTALIQNPKYNDGRPWFVEIRPTLHSPHKLSDEELAQYRKYTDMLKEIKAELDRLEKKGVDVSDARLEYGLAEGKLKEGRFRMAEIYINSLKESLSKLKK